MKRLLPLLFAAIAITLSCQGKQTGDKSLKKINDKKVFVMGLDDSFPPMGYRDENNEIVGYDVDLAREVCVRNNWTLKLQPIDWNAKEQELSTGNIDCIWNGFTITEERSRQVNFSEPYLTNAQVVVVREDSPAQNLADFSGKLIGLQAGSSAADAVDGNAEFKASLKNIVEFKDNLLALMDLEIGGVDGVAMDLLVANDNIRRAGKAFRIIGESLAPENYGIGFRLGDQALRDKVQETLLAMAKDGSVASIADRWFGADISTIGK